MKIFKTLAAVSLALSMLLCVVACSSEPTAPTNNTEANTEVKEPAKIEINIKDGEQMPNVPAGTKFSEVVKMVPTKEGYAFAGWYSDEALTDYIIPDHITDTQYSKGVLYPKWIKVDPVTYNVRADAITITDSGRANQKLDIVYLTQNMTDLKRAGYTKLNIVISFEVREENDGYQYLFLYQDENCVQPKDDNSLADAIWGDSLDEILGTDDDSDPSHIWSTQFEHNSDKKDTSWGERTFTVPVDIADIKDNLYIRYGASGKDEDDWQNRNVVVTVTPVK